MTANNNRICKVSKYNLKTLISNTFDLHNSRRYTWDHAWIIAVHGTWFRAWDTSRQLVS